ncbi:single-stranded DNA-binding protein [Actinomycetospora sp. CA-101289]|uniref:single-stranded DNA-binding protein n=1 Tax=Actinomycetospora sp. CA-101289 TaxID=3239893 RepID=UPI003D95AFEF
MNETTVTVTGNVAGDVICRRVGDGEHLLSTFRVASSERRWDKASESWVDGDRFTASVNCWRRLAEGARCLVKGDPVVVTGRLSVREYEVEGVRRYMTEIAATAIGPDLARCTAQVSRRRPSVGENPDAASTADTVDGAAPPATTSPVGVGEPVETGDGLAHAARPLVPVGHDGEVATHDPEGATVTGIVAGERRRGEPARASA